MEKIKFISLKDILVLVVVVGLVSAAIYSLDILLVLFAAFVITCTINPVINKLEKYMPRIAAVVLILFGLMVSGLLIIIPLAGVVHEFMKKDGVFISSGIIYTREQEVVEAINKNDNLVLKDVKRDGDWVMVSATLK